MNLKQKRKTVKILHKLKTASFLFIRNPSAFVSVICDRFRQKQVLSNLRQTLRRSGMPVIYSQCGPTLLPFHDDGDAQELFYHTNGTVWHAAESAILRRFLKAGDTFVDVGTNLGFITGIASRMVGPEGYVHSFEPSPVVHAKLLGVIRENGWRNVIPHNVGCGDCVGEMMLSSPTGSSGNATLTQTSSAIGPVQKVRIVRLDEYLSPQITRLDFLKIDTEGFEDHVLEGAAGLIDAYRPTIYIELASEYLQSSERAIEWLKRHDYIFESEPDMQQSHNGDNYIALHRSKLQGAAAQS